MDLRTRAVSVLVALGGLGAVGSTTAGGTVVATHPDERRTTVVFEVEGCDGCRLQVVQSRLDPGSETGVRMWSGPRAVVEDGSAVVALPSARTRGMSVVVETPEQAPRTSRTLVAFRLRGDRPGDRVTTRRVRAASAASACWAGTGRSTVTLPLVLHRTADDRDGVDGLVAFAAVGQPVLAPFHRLVDGVLAPRVNVCRP
jgi:hypothetical protein